VTGETWWSDVTAVHPGSASYRDRELNSLCARQIASQVSEAILVPDPFKLDRTQAKISKYSRLGLVGKKQATEKKRKQAPHFAAFAVSDYGELAPMAADLMEWIVHQFRLKCEQAGKCMDGVSPLDLVRDFRRRLYTGVQFALVAGCGDMICRAGQAWG